MSVRYFLDSDDSGHWYLIPADKRKEWIEFMEAVEKEEYAPEPEWAQRIDNPSDIEFSDPR